MHVPMSGKRFVIGAAIVALVAAGCGAAATATPTAAFKIHLQLTPSHVSVAIAKDQGFLKGIDLDWVLVGYGESSQLFHAGSDPIGNESPWEAATYQDQGKDIRYFGTAESTNLVSGIIVRTEDKAKYPTLASLKGKKVGIPGFGTGTFAAFQVIAKGINNLDAKTDFALVEGGPGDLEGLLQTKAIEAFITFSAPTAKALANSAYTMLYNITDEWKKTNGSYLPINGWIADAKWLDEHKEIAKNFIAGVDQGLEYYKKNLGVAHKGGKYEAFGQGEGRLNTPETTAAVDKMTADGYYLLSANVYTKTWAEGVYKFIQLGAGVLVKTVPPIGKVFYEAMYQ